MATHRRGSSRPAVPEQTGRPPGRGLPPYAGDVLVASPPGQAPVLPPPASVPPPRGPARDGGPLDGDGPGRPRAARGRHAPAYLAGPPARRARPRRRAPGGRGRGRLAWLLVLFIAAGVLLAAGVARLTPSGR